ncbi:methyltransferase domain-containing protein [Microcoleus sp. FACHB-SPT15]|uniref:methyltransferase domain-containing protein n=1 Tax=Microcoleus sp. FACHB-SPT15 TaxID=2692830 RepID=UPI0017874597|nr:class I SAM-dependent methyltransferase [Microcoleus sp. FACHB-SPT15]MBD1806537.1 methyltransferase domain-containing protein [Microcoleus sp. FACHB-SPT15]
MTSILGNLTNKLNFLAKPNKLKDTGSPSLSGTSLRQQIASQYLTGSGIEIGALHSPLEIPSDVEIRYLDRMPVEQLRKQYPELAEHKLVELDLIDDGETLASIPDASLDFVISNHMIEHCQNPIASLENWIRVLKTDGILYMAVPDKRYTFDCDRPITSLEHLIRDYTEGAEWSKYSHFEEWNRLVNKVPNSDVAVRTKRLIDMNYSIHFHVWTPMEFIEMLVYCKKYLSFLIEIELLQKNGMEFIVVLRKRVSE